jgi:uncharacterized protein YuzE
MDRHGVSDERAAESTVTVGGIVFDNNSYDAEGDVLYLHVGEPGSEVDAIGTEEGDGTFHAADGSLVGLTILNARARFENDGKIELTIPRQKFVVTDVGDVFDHRWKYVPDIVKIPGRIDANGIEFDDVEYDRAGDILYLRIAGRSPASDGAAEEAFYLQFDARGELIAITIAEARWLLEHEGKIVVTLPDGRRLEIADLGPALAA